MFNSLTSPHYRVLLIEDNPDHAFLVRRMLEDIKEFPCELIWVDHFAEGLERISQEKADVVLLDLNLPDSSGLNTLTGWLKRFPEIPIIVMTADDDIKIGTRAVEEGAQDFLIKGEFDQRLLFRAILYAIKRKEMDEALRDVLNNLEERIKERTDELTEANEKLVIINKNLEQHIIERKLIEKTFRLIVENTAQVTGMDFLHSLVKQMANTIGFRYVLLGELVEPGKDRVRTLAVWARGDYAENFEYDLAGTPCENVVQKKVCYYPRGIQQLFPEDSLLAEMGVESYLGIPLIGSQGDTLGVWVALHDKPMEKFAFSKPIFEVFATRTAAEIERKRAQEALRKVNRALITLSACNQIMVRTTDEMDFINEICRIIVEIGAYRMAWVGYAQNDQDKTVRPVAEWGDEEGYLENVNITWADTSQGRGPTGKAIRGNRPSIVQYIPTDPSYKPWRENSLKRGYASLIALPISNGGHAFGVLTIYAQEPDAFSTDEVNLLEELAEDLSFGIVNLRIRAKQQQAEEELKKSKEELQKSYNHLQTIREEERIIISREIHDEIGQIFSAIKLELSSLDCSQDKNDEATKSMFKLADSGIETVQRISSQLRPSILDDLGIVPAIEWLAEEFYKKSGIECSVTFNTEEIDLDKDRSTVVYRIFQESLTNIIRHADASKIKAGIKVDSDSLRLFVNDNGKGINKEDCSSSQSFGIISMRERALSVGGKLEIAGKKGKGTTIKLYIPLPGGKTDD